MLPNATYLTATFLRRFVPLVYRYVRPNDDIDRGGKGFYTPEARDYAQEFRNSLLDRLAKSDSPNATAVLEELAAEPVLADWRDWILHLRDERIRSEADLSPWSEGDVCQFALKHEIDPRTDCDLFKIALKRLSDIKRDVEKSDNSLRDELHVQDEEPVLRRWLERKLSERSRQRFTAPQEAVVDLEQRPDIRLTNPKTAPVSIEVKWAQRWSLSELLERLEHQLVGQYLRAHNSGYGVYLLGMIGDKKHWDEPNSSRHLSFSEVLEIIARRAAELERSTPSVRGLAVIGIDFRVPRGSD